MILVFLLSIPLAAVALIGLSRRRTTLEIIHGVSIAGTFGLGMTVAGRIWLQQTVIQLALFRADALSAFMVAIITFVAAVAGVYAVGYMRLELGDDHPSRLRLFYALFHLFIFTMLFAVTTDNLGVMWVAIEGTTLSTVFLVNLREKSTSLEAAYKYLIISSIGIALAFLGTVLMYYAAATQVGEIGLSWTSLISVAGRLNPAVVRLALVFILIGYGTKAGLAPMHTWLPDAYSEAPAPASALMSGVLSNVGLYALMRFKAVADITLGTGFSSTWLMRFGLLSLGVAAAFLMSQRNYKRMLAYSSVEHMGVAALGLGFGGYWGMLGALLHMLNHALSKSMLFVLAGSIRLKYQTTDVGKIRGLIKTAPWTGLGFLLGFLALTGMPPFGLFISEFIIFRAGFVPGLTPYAIAGIAFVVLIFAGMLRTVNSMLYGTGEPIEPGDPVRWPLAPLAINIALLIGLGLTLPNSVQAFLGQVLKVLGVSS